MNYPTGGTMPDLNETLIFAHVVQSGSFVGAAQKLDMPKSTVSRKVSELEGRLGARLLQRTTRKLSLTDVGRAYYQHAERVLAEVEAAELAVTRLQEEPRGLLRVTLPLNVAYLAPAISKYCSRYPEVTLDIVCTDHIVDLIQDGFDVGIRAGKLADSSLIAKSLGTIRNVVVASPQYLARAGVPKRPKDLESHDCIVLGVGAMRENWELREGSRTERVSVKPRLTVNDFEMLRELCIRGLGLSMIPLNICQADLDAGRLERLLPNWCSSEVPLQAVYPSTRYLSPKVRSFVEHLASPVS